MTGSWKGPLVKSRTVRMTGFPRALSGMLQLNVPKTTRRADPSVIAVSQQAVTRLEAIASADRLPSTKGLQSTLCVATVRIQP